MKESGKTPQEKADTTEDGPVAIDNTAGSSSCR